LTVRDIVATALAAVGVAQSRSASVKA